MRLVRELEQLRAKGQAPPSARRRVMLEQGAGAIAVHRGPEPLHRVFDASVMG